MSVFMCSCIYQMYMEPRVCVVHMCVHHVHNSRVLLYPRIQLDTDTALRMLFISLGIKKYKCTSIYVAWQFFFFSFRNSMCSKQSMISGESFSPCAHIFTRRFLFVRTFCRRIHIAVKTNS